MMQPRQNRLVITATPLIGRWSLTSTTNKSKAAWPPAPDTVFSALVAAAASLGNAYHPALYWLESLGNPAIDAGIAHARSEGIMTYAPVADEIALAQNARKAREHNSIGAGPVSWSWPCATTEHLAELEAIGREVTYIGSSRGPVTVSVAMSDAVLAPHAYVPDVGGQTMIRGLYRGRLDELEAAFHKGERPKPTVEVAYRRAADKRQAALWGQVIPLKRVSGQALFLPQGVAVTECVRRALTAHFPDQAPGSLTGHSDDGRTLAGVHMAVIPLSRVGDKFADGEIMGAALVLPKVISDADYAVLIQGLGKWIAAGGLVDMGSVRWTMELARSDDVFSLQERRYRRAAQGWSSVTPIVFERHPRRKLGIDDVVAKMCADVGLPRPTAVIATSDAPLKGAQSSCKHTLGTRSYLSRSFISHLRIQWQQPVRGPIVLGRGQYFGLGLMLPDLEAA